MFPNEDINKQGNMECYSHVLFVCEGTLLISRGNMNIKVSIRLLSGHVNSTSGKQYQLIELIFITDGVIIITETKKLGC